MQSMHCVIQCAILNTYGVWHGDMSVRLQGWCAMGWAVGRAMGRTMGCAMVGALLAVLAGKAAEVASMMLALASLGSVVTLA